MTHVATMMEWHFSEATGSPYWLRRRADLDVDPLTDVRRPADLRLLPDPSQDMRTLPFEDFLPRGLRDATLAGVFESGGTSGRPKRVPVFDAWLDELVRWRVGPDVPQDERGNTLAVVPTGPHVVGEINRRRARARHGVMLTVDLDPRWAKRLVVGGHRADLDAYVAHLLEQAVDVLETQEVRHLIATPPFLERLAGHPLSAKLNDTLTTVTWGGTSMDPDALAYLRSDVLPDVRIEGSYGNTMMLGEAKQIGWVGDDPVFAPFSPYVTLDVLDRAGQPAADGQEGRVVAHHVSRYALIPNVVERDLATKVLGAASGDEVCVRAVRPLPTLDGEAMVEGVY